ncbi:MULTISPECIES: ATP-binding protein [unclassified Fibrobacter]|uniref:ATP-binding protein n=1 Tax=unclassified Fibrobacter TaxID=2634177 RepID=UPI000D6AEBB3|nr:MULTISPECIES: ATP-binding protein [unclassified Fibrobacter]PWJ59134.1 ATPase family protein associated with various cellular activities (AAA) [Fibrobacter sp. UWR4]PZW63438.1 ATPase family protein associated with various cellular activities (AAA) [Fibrobacter sp. UWR1]
MNETLYNEIIWCRQIIDARFEQYFSAEDDVKKLIQVQTIFPPELDEESPYAQLVLQNQLNFEERFILALSLLPHLCPQALDSFFLNNKVLGRPYTEFGGWHGKSHSGFLPTCETALFLLAGDHLGQRIHLMRLFESDSKLISNHILQLEYGEPGEPKASAALRISSEYLEYVTTGVRNKPDYSLHFPAKRITTRLDWSDLVLNDITRGDIDQLLAWIEHSEEILGAFGLRKNLKRGYRVLFYGPPGTGKTLTATLVGKKVGMDVYRVDLSQVVSKYIGETEKNLSNIFDQAESHNWILFFDEADSLFGARTQTNNSNDRAANQEISYLLQRVEDFPGIVILASNLKSNIDEAFSRRFQNAIYFPLPEPEERRILWSNIFELTPVENRDELFDEFAEKYELAGGALTNVARYAALSALMNGRQVVNRDDIQRGLAKELQKEGKML